MKSIVMPKNAQLDEKIKNQLTAQSAVKETLATDVVAGEEKKLTAVDMWNLHRNSRSASAMLRRWNLN